MPPSASAHSSAGNCHNTVCTRQAGHGASLLSRLGMAHRRCPGEITEHTSHSCDQRTPRFPIPRIARRASHNSQHVCCMQALSSGAGRRMRAAAWDRRSRNASRVPDAQQRTPPTRRAGLSQWMPKDLFIAKKHRSVIMVACATILQIRVWPHAALAPQPPVAPALARCR
jgi:hypothetical protein